MKTVVVGVTGGIAAFKSAQLVSDLVKAGYDVQVLMTEHAKEFISPLTFETLTKHNVPDTFERNFVYDVKHISIAQKADVFLIAPATANVIAKVANGIADDMLTTTFLAANCKKLIAPAMNTAMYENPVTQENLEKCRRFGMEIIEPESGRLACGDTGKGKLAGVSELFDAVVRACFTDDCLKGYHVLVTAGPTIEAMDPVRFLSNHSSGKMGFAIAKMAQRCGANVTLVAGPNHLTVPYGVTYVPVTSAQSMMDAICAISETQDIIIKAAAVADYRPKTVAKEKMKKGDGELVLELERNPDILAHLGAHKPAKQVLCGFAMETEHVLENARKKLEKKNLDLIVVNDLREEGAGFAVDSNRVTIIEPDKETALPLMSKEDVAYELCKMVAKKRKEKDA